MSCKSKILIPVFLLFYFKSVGQIFEYEGIFSAKGILFSKEESPFWMHSNQRGRINEEANFSGFLSAKIQYNITPEANLSLGGGLLYQDGYIDELQADELYLAFENSWLISYIGRRQREELYRGLSATNENIIYSLNARPLPGIGFKIKRPLYFWKSAGLGVEGGLEEFVTDDDRYVKNTRIHHKFLELIYTGIPNFQFKAGIQHFVQWAGTSPDFGPLPSGFEDYLSVVTGRGVGEEVGGGNEVNGLGNHLGSYVLGVKKSTRDYNIELIYNHIFEDGSGSRLGNTPDGRYGIYVEDKNPGDWLDAIMYEFYYTKHQSSTSTTSDGADNYFNNHLYRSGWTYEKRVLGVPFMFLDAERFRIINNKFIAHHVGISGTGLNMPYRFLASYRKNYGAKGGGQLRSDIFSAFLDMQVFQNSLNMHLMLGADFSNVESPNLGAGIQLSKKLF